jgi:hypothetical protein
MYEHNSGYLLDMIIHFNFSQVQPVIGIEYVYHMYWSHNNISYTLSHMYSHNDHIIIFFMLLYSNVVYTRSQSHYHNISL